MEDGEIMRRGSGGPHSSTSRSSSSSSEADDGMPTESGEQLNEEFRQLIGVRASAEASGTDDRKHQRHQNIDLDNDEEAHNVFQRLLQERRAQAKTDRYDTGVEHA